MQNPQQNDSTRFSSVNIPPLPQTLIRLMEICNDPESDIVLVGQTVNQDVSIASKILKLANSAFLGSRTKFINIEQAVIYLGIDTVHNLAISVSVHETFKADTHFQSMNIEEFWYHSLLTALLAKEIAELTKYVDPGEAYLAGLLHDVGKCLMNESFPDQYTKLQNIHAGSAELHVVENETFGVSHAAAGGWLAQHWHLKKSLAQAINLHHVPVSDSTDAAHLDTILFLANATAGNLQEKEIHIKEGAKQLQLTFPILQTLLTEQQSIVLEIAESLGITVRAPDETTKLPSADTLAKKIQSLAKVYGILDNLVKAQTANRVFLVLEESIQILFGCEKCVLLLPDDENTQLSVRGSFRNRLRGPLQTLNIPLQGGNMPCWQSPHTRKLVSIDQTSSPEPDSITKTLFDVFQESSIFTLSFAIDDTKRGILLLAPNHQNHTTIQEQEDILLLLCTHVGSRLQLENLKRQHADSIAKESIATMDEVARSLAHEISNPLSIIQNYISLLNDKASGATNMREELDIIRREIERIGDISKQLNDLSVVPETRVEELTNIYTVINETLQLFRQSAMIDKKAFINFRSESELPDILVKTDSLRQILYNLLTNSLDAINFGGVIEVHCHLQPASNRNNKDLIISITDDGPGIPPAIAAKIFRAGQTTKGKGHAGLGLAIVKKLTSDLAGQISCSTDKTGRTQFILLLPVKNPPAR